MFCCTHSGLSYNPLGTIEIFVLAGNQAQAGLWRELSLSLCVWCSDLS